MFTILALGLRLSFEQLFELMALLWECILVVGTNGGVSTALTGCSSFVIDVL